MSNQTQDATGYRPLTDELAVRAEQQDRKVQITRDEAILGIRAALKHRTGLTWSVTGGRGTGWGWIRVTAPPKRRTGARIEYGTDEQGSPLFEHVDTGIPSPYGLMTPKDIRILKETLDLDAVSPQGIDIPASSDYYAEYVARADGRAPAKIAVPYWD